MSKSKEPTRAQLSSRLAYSAQTPAFLLKLQRKIGGQQDDEDEPEYEDYDDGSGRPPIPRRPAIPQRPDDDPGSADEDDGEEKPQIVVLREGKHLTELEVENEKRKAKGLPPLPVPSSITKEDDLAESSQVKSATKSKQQSLSFSSRSKSAGSSNASNGKRKAAGDGKHDEQDDGRKKKSSTTSKKPKKAEKKLLSFDED